MKKGSVILPGKDCQRKIELVFEDDKGIRLDVWLSDSLDSISRTYIKRLIESGNVLLNGINCKPNQRLQAGDSVEVILPKPGHPAAKPENISINVVYEDNHLIVVDKPQGMVVHPAPGNREGTLVNALLNHCRGTLSDINGVIRPGIVHRIDKDTSGIIVAAKTNQAHMHLAEKFKNHDIRRVYFSIVNGIIDKERGKIGRHPVNRKEMSVNTTKGKKAVTHFKVIERLDNASMVEIQLETGRTHQIRVHMSYIGHPVLGDDIYGRKSVNRRLSLNRQALHAGILGFEHPVTGQYCEFKSEIPEYMKELVETLRKQRSHKITLND